MPGNGYLIYVKLRWKGEGRVREMIFAETHLKAMATPECTKIRVREVTRLFQDFAANLLEQNIPVIVAGDFNDEPLSDPIKLMVKNKFTDLHVLSKNDYPEYTLICDVNKE